MQTGVASVESSMEFPQKTKNGTAFWPSDSTTGNISKGTQNTNPNEYIHRYVHCGFIYNTQDLEATEVSVDEGIKKLCYIYTMEYYAAERKKELIPFVTAWVELESIILNEIKQLVKDKYLKISPVRGT